MGRHVGRRLAQNLPLLSRCLANKPAAMNELEIGLAPLRELGAGIHIRPDATSRPAVVGIQCGRTAAGDAHVALIAEYPSLRAVGLQHTRITDKALSYFKKLPHLESLDLVGTSITDAGLAHLVDITWLEFLHLEGTHLTKPAVEALRRRLPNCEIYSDFK
jgi:hypothetical protein